MKTDNRNIEYKLLTRHSASHVELEFGGTLLQAPVIWHAHIHTLKDYSLTELANPVTDNSIIQGQSFIDITIQDDIYKLTVALNLPVIDDAAILRTIIMIRQYKRLQPGRHYYGEISTFRFDTN